MREFSYRNKWQSLLQPDIVSMLSQIHEFKGDLLKRGDIIKISGGRYTNYIWNRENDE